MAPRLACFVLAWASLLLVARCDVEIASPVRRIVSMLRMMSSKVADRSKKEEENFEKFQCYCDTQMKTLRKSMSGGTVKVPQLEANIKEIQATISGLANELVGQKSDLKAAVTALSEATEIRKSDRATFLKDSAALKDNIKALSKATGVLTQAQKEKDDKSNAVSLLQGTTAAFVQNVADSISPDVLRSTDRQQLVNLLQTAGTMGTEDIPEVLTVLNTMLGDMRDDLKSLTDDELKGLASFQALQQAKTREKNALTAAIQEKKGRHSSLQVELARMKADLDDTKSGVASSFQLFSQLKGQCDRKSKDFAAMKKSLAEEQIALSDTIKLLSDEKANMVFSKTVRLSFLQRSSRSRRGSGETRKAVELLRQMSMQHPDRPALGLLAAHAAKAARLPRSGLEKIAKLIDQMLDALVKEQKDDSLKKQMCQAELRRNGEHQSKVKEKIEAKAADLAAAQDQLTVMTRDIDALRASIANLDQSVKQATEERKDANTEAMKVLAENRAALDLLTEAKSRLRRYYSDIKKAALIQKKERSITVHNRGEGVDAFVEEVGFLASDTQSQAVVQEMDDAADSVKQHAQGVIQLISTIQEQLKKEFADTEKEEAKDQAEYEDLMKASSAKRDADAKALTVRARAKAGLHETKLKLGKRKAALDDDLAQTQKVIANLHKECDKTLKNYDVRQAARKAETEALQKTRVVLKGANTQLSQASAQPAKLSRH